MLNISTYWGYNEIVFTIYLSNFVEVSLFMDLMEYQAQQLFMTAGLPVKKGVVASDASELLALAKGAAMTYPLVIKAQVQIGGRGKAGGIKFADNEEELKNRAQEIIGMNIKGHQVNLVMAVEKADVAKEMYLSIMLDRLSKKPVIMFCAQGGMEIETVTKEHPELMIKTFVDPRVGVSGYTGQYLADQAGLSGDSAKQMQELVRNLYKCFMDNHCTLTEINPLVIDNSGNLCALDGKISIDDSAVSIHENLAAFKVDIPGEAIVEEAKKNNFFCVPCEPDGTVAVICNGSGMLMNTIDRVSNKGFKVCLALDLGGGAAADRVKEAVRIVSEYDKVGAILINVFGGITRCDEVANGIKEAMSENNIDIDMILRLEGSNKEAGAAIAATIPKIIHAEDLNEGLDLLAQRMGAQA